MKKELVLKSNKYLANIAINYGKLHNLHWNVIGLQFKPVHEYLESLYDNMHEVLDEVSELLKMNGDIVMAVSYNKLWKLMIDKGFNKTRLREEAKISSNAMAKLGKNETVQVEVLAKICNHLDCTMDDIMEVITDKA